MAAMCTSSDTYKIKKAESTNKMFILDLPSRDHKGIELKTQTSLQIEFSVTKPKTFQILTYLQNHEYTPGSNQIDSGMNCENNN